MVNIKGIQDSDNINTHVTRNHSNHRFSSANWRKKPNKKQSKTRIYIRMDNPIGVTPAKAKSTRQHESQIQKVTMK